MRFALQQALTDPRRRWSFTRALEMLLWLAVAVAALWLAMLPPRCKSPMRMRMGNGPIHAELPAEDSPAAQGEQP